MRWGPPTKRCVYLNHPLPRNHEGRTRSLEFAMKRPCCLLGGVDWWDSPACLCLALVSLAVLLLGHGVRDHLFVALPSSYMRPSDPLSWFRLVSHIFGLRECASEPEWPSFCLPTPKNHCSPHELRSADLPPTFIVPVLHWANAALGKGHRDWTHLSTNFRSVVVASFPALHHCQTATTLIPLAFPPPTATATASSYCWGRAWNQCSGAAGWRASSLSLPW